MTAPAKKKAHVISSFTDAGTGESFTADATPMIEAGVFANYEAAGLVRAAAAERKPRTPAKSKATATRRSTPRRGSTGTSDGARRRCQQVGTQRAAGARTDRPHRITIPPRSG